MIEMLVQAVEPTRRNGHAVAVLAPRVVSAYPRLALSITTGEARALVHDLKIQDTFAGLASAVLARAVTGLHGKLSAVELLPTNGGTAAAQLTLKCPGGHTRVPLEVGRALGLAVRLRLPLLASKGLFRAIVANDSTSNAGGRVNVPDASSRVLAV